MTSQVPTASYKTTLSSLMREKKYANTRQEQMIIIHKIYIIVNENQQSLSTEYGFLSQAIYGCALNKRDEVISKSRGSTELHYAKLVRTNMSAFCEYYEGICLGTHSKMTTDVFRHINSYLRAK